MEIQIKKKQNKNSPLLEIRRQIRLRESLSFTKILPSKIRRISKETMKNISKVNKFTFSQIFTKVFPIINILLEAKRAYVTFISQIYSKNSVLEWASKNKSLFLGQYHLKKKKITSKKKHFRKKMFFSFCFFSWSYS